MHDEAGFTFNLIMRTFRWIALFVAAVIVVALIILWSGGFREPATAPMSPGALPPVLVEWNIEPMEAVEGQPIRVSGKIEPGDAPLGFVELFLTDEQNGVMHGEGWWRAEEKRLAADGEFTFEITPQAGPLWIGAHFRDLKGVGNDERNPARRRGYGALGPTRVMIRPAATPAPKPLLAVQSVPPALTRFDITPTNAAPMETIVLEGDVALGSAPLKQVELWRAVDEHDSMNGVDWKMVGIRRGPSTTTNFRFQVQLPRDVYWFGIHLVDQRDKKNDELNASNRPGFPVLGPRRVVVE